MALWPVDRESTQETPFDRESVLTDIKHEIGLSENGAWITELESVNLPTNLDLIVIVNKDITEQITTSGNPFNTNTTLIPATYQIVIGVRVEKETSDDEEGFFPVIAVNSLSNFWKKLDKIVGRQ